MVMACEQVTVTRPGRPIARIAPVAAPRLRIGLPELKINRRFQAAKFLHIDVHQTTSRR